MPLQESRHGDSLHGQALYEANQCAACHRLGESGRNIGPPLDGAGSRIRRDWLVQFLVEPRSVLANARMPDYSLSIADASDLAAYLSDGQTSKAVTGYKSPDSLLRSGLSVFAQRGCAACHRIGTSAVSLAPQDAAEAEVFVAYHKVPRASGPVISLRPAEVGAMAKALTDGGAEEPQPDEAAFLEEFWRTPIPAQGPVPAAYDSVAASLSPEACGRCHTRQLHDWRTSLHARSMGPGVLGQLIDEDVRDPE